MNYWTRKTLSRRAAIRGAGVAGLGAAAYGLAGCGDDDSGTKATTAPQTGGTSAATSAPATAAATPTKVDLTKLSDADFFKAVPSNWPKDYDDKDIKMGGRHVLLTKSLASQNPWSASDQSRWQVQSVYSTMLRPVNSQGVKSMGAKDVEGDLASKWETPDLQTVVLTLWPNIKFQNVAPVNGRAMTADDVKYSLDKAKTYAKSTLAKSHNAFIQSVEDIGNNQIRLKLSRPEPLAASWLALQRVLSVIPKEIGESDDLLEQKPIGTGGFIQKSFTPNVEIVYDKNPDYFKTDKLNRKLPYMDGWRALLYKDDQTGVNTFLAEQGEWSQASLLGADPFTAVRDLLKQASNMHMLLAAPGWGYTGISGKNEVDGSPWKDVRVRRALSMLVPRDAIITSLHKGQGAPFLNFPWAFLSDTPPLLKDMGQWYQFNPKDAKAMLDAAGVGDKAWDLEYYPGPNGIEQECILFQDEAGKAGVKINLVKQPDYVTILQRMGARAFKDLSQHHHNAPLFIDPAGTMIDYVDGQPEDATYARTNDSVMNDLYAKLQATPVGDARKALGKQVQDRMLDQVFEVQLIPPYALSTFHPRFKNWLPMNWAASYNSIFYDTVWLDPTAKLKG